jgi:hypothetical protein
VPVGRGICRGLQYTVRARAPATRIARRDAHRLMPEAGLRALELERDSGWIAFPRLRRVQWLRVIRLISITVAGAAPALDESAPDFPFNRSQRAQRQPAAARVGTDTSCRAKPASA